MRAAVRRGVHHKLERVEEDLQDQIQELRREINELRVVVYTLMAAGLIAILMAAGLSFGQAAVALAGCVVVYAVYEWARDKIADWWESRAAS